MSSQLELKILEELENFIEAGAMKALQNAFREKQSKNKIWEARYEGQKVALFTVREEIQRLKELKTNA